NLARLPQWRRKRDRIECLTSRVGREILQGNLALSARQARSHIHDLLRGSQRILIRASKRCWRVEYLIDCSTRGRRGFGVGAALDRVNRGCEQFAPDASAHRIVRQRRWITIAFVEEDVQADDRV